MTYLEFYRQDQERKRWHQLACAHRVEQAGEVEVCRTCGYVGPMVEARVNALPCPYKRVRR